MTISSYNDSGLGLARDDFGFGLARLVGRPAALRNGQVPAGLHVDFPRELIARRRTGLNPHRAIAELDATAPMLQPSPPSVGEGDPLGRLHRWRSEHGAAPVTGQKVVEGTVSLD